LQLYEEPFAVFPATVNSADNEMAIKKLVGRWIVDVMPEEGINEALIALRDIAKFYYERSQRIHSLLAEPRQHAGRVIGTSERPDLVI